MALNVPTFVNGLIKAETPPRTSVAEAALGFTEAFTEYFKTSIAGIVPVTVPTCYLPTTQSVLQGGIAGAFSLTSAAAVAAAIEAAIIAYLNAGPIAAFYTAALSVASPGTLPVLMTSINTPVAKQTPAKTAVATAITTWFSNVIVTFPGGVTAPIT
jgi:hypothetical protein